MKLKRFSTTLLASILLLVFSLNPAVAVGASGEIVVMPRASGRVDHSISANSKIVFKPAFSLDADETIKFECTYTPKSASVDFGVIAPDGLFHYVNCTSGSIDKSIRVEEAGEYTMVIRNNSSYTVTVTGTVRY